MSTSQASPTYSAVDLPVYDGTAEAQVCLACGALVSWTETHNEWHAGLDRVLDSLARGVGAALHP